MIYPICFKQLFNCYEINKHIEIYKKQAFISGISEYNSMQLEHKTQASKIDGMHTKVFHETNTNNCYCDECICNCDIEIEDYK
jgi:hypothetical protein